MIDAEAEVETFDEIDSTVLEARRRIESGDLSPVWLIARVQTAGRGRRGRTWSSLSGNLMATHVFITDAPPNEVALLGFATGLAIAQTLDEVMGSEQTSLKWPNDVLIDGAKVAGILIDSGSLGTRAWVALSFGVNVAAAPEGLDQPVTCLRMRLPQGQEPPTAHEFFLRLRPALEAWAARLSQEGFEPLRLAWLAKAYGMGREARVLAGDSVIMGTFTGLSGRGELELETASGPRSIAAGDVFFPKTA